MVAAIVGIRKAMDYFPNIFTQRELSWLDDVIPDEQKERLRLSKSVLSRVSSEIFTEAAIFSLKIISIEKRLKTILEQNL